jgi:predicted house-cleaning noncanonical NTP pyrophosphatase (MazG superfamily)
MADSRSADEKSRPLPNRSIKLVTGSDVSTIDPPDITSADIGLKALGLLLLPAPWTPAFFVVSGSSPPDEEAILAAASALGLSATSHVYVRSSGSKEGMEERGALDSSECTVGDVVEAINALKLLPSFAAEQGKQRVHFVVQRRVNARAKGHLSNERRLSRHYRDWHMEIEGVADLAAVGVRKWRNSSSASAAQLHCESRALLPHALRAVASWINSRRSHVEWVWDGLTVWIVQLDFLEPRKGVLPSDLVSHTKRPSLKADSLSVFVPSTAEELKKYPKLNNARLYVSLGYKMPSFYALVDQSVIREIVQNGVIPRKLEEDLSKLCSSPFVLRTDAVGLRGEERQMLPRSDELRSSAAAICWLLVSFRESMQRLKNASEVVLIGHHFLPAAASAWCLAMPNERRVRIEALWGIPEGMYFFAHDVYDVDTMHLDLSKGDVDSCVILSTRERYKDKFVAPNSNGEWIVHHTAEGPDWSGSIRKAAWAKEIAWISRKIAAERGEPVVVMWFVDLPAGQLGHKVLPWYHEPYERVDGKFKKAAPRKKFSSSHLLEVRGAADWSRLKANVNSGARVERVLLNPDDSTILRSQEFVDELAAHARDNGYIVELRGGVLSHLFYMLTKKGCSVEVVDLFGVDQENIDYNKIVRDKIPSDIESRGELVEVVKLSGDALLEALKRKLVEESFEAVDARTADDIGDEIADVLEVIDSLIAALGFTEKDIEARKERKRQKRGGFEQSLMLVRTSLPSAMSGELESKERDQRRMISRIEELPRADEDFHVDRRIDSVGTEERQLTITLPAQSVGYAAGEHRFDLSTPDGGRHEMFFNARLERNGATLRLRIRLTNAAVQLSLPLDNLAP